MPGRVAQPSILAPSLRPDILAGWTTPSCCGPGRHAWMQPWSGLQIVLLGPARLRGCHRCESGQHELRLPSPAWCCVRRSACGAPWQLYSIGPSWVLRAPCHRVECAGCRQAAVACAISGQSSMIGSCKLTGIWIRRAFSVASGTCHRLMLRPHVCSGHTSARASCRVAPACIVLQRPLHCPSRALRNPVPSRCLV